ncbi:hypothetical protein Q5752_005453 [Cryptotrichosporon argae]
MLAPATRALATARGDDFHTIMVGAGFAMFGTPEGPWNMSRRAENRLGPRLKVDAVVDVTPDRALEALAAKRASAVAGSYADTTVVSSIEEYVAKVRVGAAAQPRAIFIASSPDWRGSCKPGRDLELQIHHHFPRAALLLEKPVATGAPWAESVADARAVAAVLEAQHEGVVSVAYKLRYLKAVQEIKRILEENKLTPMAVHARFVVAYEYAVKTAWWTNSVTQGPIIEQGTHMIDLVRYLAGDIDNASIAAHTVGAHEAPGRLTKKNFDESVVPAHDRIPRATAASWKFETGAVGSFLHAIVLHDKRWEVQLEVYADGYQLVLQDPYGTPRLLVRAPGQETHDVREMPGDDPYQTEMDNFIDAIEGGPDPRILSTYADAVKSYETTWHVRNAGEASAAAFAARHGA